MKEVFLWTFENKTCFALIAGYGYQVVCTDCLEGRAMYSKDPDYCPQSLPSIDCLYEKPQSNQDSYRNGIDHSHLPNCQQSYNKTDASEFVYPSNHERVPLFSEQKSHVLISDAQGNIPYLPYSHLTLYWIQLHTISCYLLQIGI